MRAPPCAHHGAAFGVLATDRVLIASVRPFPLLPQERMRRLEALRLELDSRRRTVSDLQGEQRLFTEQQQAVVFSGGRQSTACTAVCLPAILQQPLVGLGTGATMLRISVGCPAGDLPHASGSTLALCMACCMLADAVHLL
jgi:hypothetical protein